MAEKSICGGWLTGRLRPIVGLVLVAVMNGCVPNAVSYYYPVLEGGTVSAANCVPTDSLLDFEIRSGGATVGVSSRADDGRIHLGFSGNSWNTIGFLSSEFVIRDPDAEVETVSSSVHVHHDGHYGPLVTEPYSVPKSSPASQMVNLPRLSLSVRFDGPMPKRFDLVAPLMAIDGARIEIPTIRFEKRVWMGVSPFNC